MACWAIYTTKFRLSYCRMLLLFVTLISTLTPWPEPAWSMRSSEIPSDTTTVQRRNLAASRYIYSAKKQDIFLKHKKRPQRERFFFCLDFDVLGRAYCASWGWIIGFFNFSWFGFGRQVLLLACKGLLW